METSSIHTQTNSFGLLFEPEFFDIYQFSDFDGNHFLSSERKTGLSFEKPQHLVKANPLFSFSTNPVWTLVPTAIFREEDKGIYLQLNTSFEVGNEECDYEDIAGIGVTLIYQRDQKAEELTGHWNPGLALRHIAVPLILDAREKSRNQEGPRLTVWMFERVAKILICKGGEIVFANSTSTEEAVDLVYFIMYALRELDLPPSLATEIHGNSNTAKSAVNELKKYLPNISWTDDKSAEVLSKILSECES